LIADFLPAGAPPQLVQRSFVTAGYSGPLLAAGTLHADGSDKVVANTRVKLTMPDAGWIHSGPNDSFVNGNAALPLNAWNHMAVTYDGASLRFFLNGASGHQIFNRRDRHDHGSVADWRQFGVG
jgi:hypothetical protein